VARPAKLKKLALLLGLVLASHAAGLQWIARHLAPVSVLKPMAPPMLTRLLAPAAPPPVAEAPVVKQPRPRPRRQAVAVAPRPAASSPQEQVVVAAPGPPPAVPAVAAAPQAAASAPQAVASAPAAADALGPWPPDTKLSYRLGGQFRSGELYGDARVQWQREGNRYQVRVDIDVTLWTTMVITSQGEVTAEGLMPHAYEELRTGKRRAARFGEEVLALEHGKTAPRPPGMQDSASQFVELAQRFATGRERLEVGRTVGMWMARPGAVDHWVYDIVEREILQTPNFGPVEAFRLKPRPIANPRGNITHEMWFAPSLQYLPVRIKVLMGKDDFVDLLVDKIEQR